MAISMSYPFSLHCCIKLRFILESSLVIATIWCGNVDSNKSEWMSRNRVHASFYKENITCNSNRSSLTVKTINWGLNIAGPKHVSVAKGFDTKTYLHQNVRAETSQRKKNYCQNVSAKTSAPKRLYRWLQKGAVTSPSIAIPPGIASNF